MVIEFLLSSGGRVTGSYFPVFAGGAEIFSGNVKFCRGLS